MSERIVVRAIVRGRVQGVGFRAWTQDRAEREGLAGWVRNRADGSVEAVVAGQEEAIRAFLKLLREGPRGSRVDAFEELPVDETESASLQTGQFDIRRTAEV